MNRVVSLMSAVWCVVVVSLLAPAEEPPHALQLENQRAIVFKDGYALVVKRGVAVTNENGELFLDDVPDAAVLGSFWATPKEGRLMAMTAGWVDDSKVTTKQAPCSGTSEVLEANVGKQVSLELTDNSVIEGTILRVLTKPAETNVTPEQWAALGESRTAELVARVRNLDALAHTTRTMEVQSATQFVFATLQGETLLNVSEVRRIVAKELITKVERKITTKKRTKRLTFRFEKPNQERELLITYFRPGVRWIPTYRINLTEEAAQPVAAQEGEDVQKPLPLAEISMQAELLNEAEDLVDTPLDIVVGVPNFRFRETVSPLVLEAQMQNALLTAAPNLMGNYQQQFSNSLYTQRAGEFRRGQPAPQAQPDPAAAALPQELTASAAQELFIYSLPKLTLRKGERAAVPVMTAKVPYRNVHTWELQVKRADIALAPSGSKANSPLKLSQNRIWRQVELQNTTQLPWTTGAAMFMQDRQPLAQELLTYTSPGGACRIPVTVAVDLRGDFEEAEVDRELKALIWDGHHYARIAQEAKLAVHNYKSTPIELEIEVRLGGAVDKASDDGQVALSPYRAEDWEHYRGSPAVNNSSVVRWSTTAAPGKDFAPTVQYHFYTRH